MLSVFDVANFFLYLVDEDIGDGISNLKLQKLVYYAQGFYLAAFDEPLFPEAIEAWTHGPVVPELYRKYKHFGANILPYPDDINFKLYDQKTKEILNEVFEVYGQYSAAKLRALTHGEPPWKKTYGQNNCIISHIILKKFFKTLWMGND